MKKFIKQHKYFILAFLIFITIAIISGYQSLKISNNKLLISNQIQIKNEQIFNTTSPNHLVTTSQNIVNVPAVQNVQIEQLEQVKQLNNLNTSTTNESNNKLPITSYQLQVTDYIRAISPTSTVYNLMQYASADSRQPFSFKTKTFSGMGEFVEEINGLINNTQTGKYWIYYINGESAKMGISQQIVKPNDIITWKYETTNL